MSQGADDRLFKPVHVLFDKVTRTLQIQQGIGHDLPWAMVGHLTASVGGDDRNGAGIENVAGQAS